MPARGVPHIAKLVPGFGLLRDVYSTARLEYRQCDATIWCFRRAIKTAPSSPIARLINDFFQQMHDHLRLKDDSGPSAFSLLLRLLSNHFNHGDQGRAFEKL